MLTVNINRVVFVPFHVVTRLQVSVAYVEKSRRTRSNFVNVDVCVRFEVSEQFRNYSNSTHFPRIEHVT
jgi:hypothetical protein